MKHFNVPDINSAEYWDSHQTAMDFGLRQQKYLELAGEGYSICEMGCGRSPFLNHAKEKFLVCWGVDFSPETIKANRNDFPDIQFMEADVTDTRFRHKEFDVCVAGEVIEHMKEPEELIKEMVRITQKKIIISTPHLEFIDPEHLWEFTEEDLINLLKPYGEVKTETVHSERFPGRSYIFATCELS